MGRLFAILVLPLLLSAQAAPLPAGDLTAIYVNDAGVETTRVEIAANGDLRIGDNSSSYWLWHDGQGYFVQAGAGGPVVERLADIATARVAAGLTAAPPAGPTTDLIESGTAVVNGRTGTIYSVRGNQNPDLDWLPAISRDPALQPVGRAFAREAEFVRVTSIPGMGGTDMTGLFANGTPLRFGGAKLKSIDAAPIAAARFALPAEPEPSARVRDDWQETFAPRDEPGSPADRATINRQTFKRAIFSDGKLWLLSDRGALTTIDPGRKAATTETAPGKVVDLCRGAAGPVVLAQGAAAGTWTLKRLVAGNWQDAGTIAGGGEALVAMTCRGDRVTLLTARRLIDVSPAGQKAVMLKGEVGRVLVNATLYDAGDVLFVGINAGEWGGGLRRIVRATGKVSQIERRGSDPCEGPLSAVCEPVNGIAAMPGRPDCIVVAVGLVHFVSSGSLVRVCGDEITPIYWKPYTIERWAGYDPQAPKPNETVAFFGLSDTPAGIWAVGLDGLYSIGERDAVSFRKMPEFETIDGISVSFAMPDVVLVSTTINQRASISGAVPMLVPR